MEMQTITSNGGRVSSKKCEFCGDLAQYSLAFVLSTVGVRPRRQKCSSVVLICDDCIRDSTNPTPRYQKSCKPLLNARIHV